MNYKEMDFKHSYINCGEENLTDSFLNPALKCTKNYKRSVGYFSSRGFEPIMDGLVQLSRNGGSIKLIASPMLEEADIKAIEAGYEKRKIAREAFTRSFVEESEMLSDLHLQLLISLISTGVMDIKIAMTETSGEYHDKLGVMEDFEGNKMAFYGSANATLNAYRNNYEKVRLVKGWLEGDAESVLDEEEEFDSLWKGSNPYVKTYEYSDVAKNELVKIVNDRKNGNGKKEVIKLRDYQEEAIEAWKNNGFKGFYVMATGTGKTFTAIYSAKELLKEKSCLITICAPYKHLVMQWYEDVKNVFKEADIVLISSENSKWQEEVSDAISWQKLDSKRQIILISTIASFNSQKFEKVIAKSKQDKLLIVDEAHRFGIVEDATQKRYKYLLGLSATPFSGKSRKSGDELMDSFGGEVYDLPIERALERGFLVKYNYHPIFVSATEEEENNFNKYSQIMASCFRNGALVDSDRFVSAHRGRLRVISMAEEKMDRLEELIGYVENKNHFIVYCGDGKLFGANGNDEIRHIQFVKKVLSDLGIKASQFTAKENIKERMSLVENFNKGNISALTAIRCLDEGINIPSIKSALILSSNDNYREFVQRRGRILRKYDGKEYADIYDVVVLPSSWMTAWAKIELRRVYEYGRLAENWNEEVEEILYNKLDDYKISFDEMESFDYEEVEEELDE